MNKEKILIFDSTLRDGAQGEGISYSVSDKLSIVRALDDFGVDYIEAGNPGSNPKDIAFFREVRGDTLKHARLCAFGSTHKKGATPENDPNVLSLLRAKRAVSLFGKAWICMRTGADGQLEENLDLVGNTAHFTGRARGHL